MIEFVIAPYDQETETVNVGNTIELTRRELRRIVHALYTIGESSLADCIHGEFIGLIDRLEDPS